MEQNKQYSKREIISALGAYTTLFLVISTACVFGLKACANGVDQQEQQAKEWQQRFERGESVDVQVRIIGSK